MAEVSFRLGTRVPGALVLALREIRRPDDDDDDDVVVDDDDDDDDVDDNDDAAAAAADDDDDDVNDVVPVMTWLGSVLLPEDRPLLITGVLRLIFGPPAPLKSGDPMMIMIMMIMTTMTMILL
jgi:hypothetical protein